MLFSLSVPLRPLPASLRKYTNCFQKRKYDWTTHGVNRKIYHTRETFISIFPILIFRFLIRESDGKQTCMAF